MTPDEKVGQLVDGRARHPAPRRARLQLVERGAARRRPRRHRHRVPAGHRPRRDLGRGADAPRGRRRSPTRRAPSTTRPRAHGERGRYQGLTFWSPNINIFRDPRWGRGQETYGEDPFLTARLGVAFVKATAGRRSAGTARPSPRPSTSPSHSGPEAMRHALRRRARARTTWHDTYLPAFQAAVREGEGRRRSCAPTTASTASPASASPTLLADSLRGAWGFDGYVVSDCGAIERHLRGAPRRGQPPRRPRRWPLKAGTDLSCGSEFRGARARVGSEGLVTDARIDQAVTRLFTARFRLGMFDPPAAGPAVGPVPPRRSTRPRTARWRVEAARASIVLAREPGGALPLAAGAAPPGGRRARRPTTSTCCWATITASRRAP